MVERVILRSWLECHDDSGGRECDAREGTERTPSAVGEPARREEQGYDRQGRVCDDPGAFGGDVRCARSPDHMTVADQRVEGVDLAQRQRSPDNGHPEQDPAHPLPGLGRDDPHA